MKSIKKVLPDGTILYRNKDCCLHREDGPAWIWSDGNKSYWLNGKPYSYEDWLELVKDPISRKWREFCEVN